MIDKDLLAEIRDQIRCDTATGFESPEMIAANAIDAYAKDCDPDDLAAVVHAMVREDVAAQVQAQADWPAVTDCDRLDAAFEALEKSGIVARQHFSCCGTCGAAEIWDEVDKADEQGATVRGYTFYHMQDSQNAVDGDGIFLAYGSVEDGDAAAVAIGREVEAAMQAQGFDTDWDGSLDHRIGVGLDWKRRLVTPASWLQH